MHPQQGAEKQRIISHPWIYRNLRRNTAVGSQAVRYCLSGLKAFRIPVFLDGGCSAVRAWGLLVNDLYPEHVRLGLENWVAFVRPNPYFPVQVTTDCWHFLEVKACLRPTSPKGVLTCGTFLSVLGTCCDLPCYSNADVGIWAVLLQSSLCQGRSLKSWKAEGLALFGILVCHIAGCSSHPQAILILPLICLYSWARGDSGWNYHCPKKCFTAGVPHAGSAPVFLCDVLFNSGSVALQLSQTQVGLKPCY